MKLIHNLHKNTHPIPVKYKSLQKLHEILIDFFSAPKINPQGVQLLLYIIFKFIINKILYIFFLSSRTN